MALGSTPSIRICKGHWVTTLAISYEVATSEMVPMPIREMGTTTIGKMWVLVQGVRQLWMIPKDNIVEPIQQVELKDILEPAFVRSQRRRYIKPN